MSPVCGVITIDGPAASGKSSVAREVARRLGVPFVSSGLLYRGVAWMVLNAGLANADEEAVMACLDQHSVELVPGLQGNLLILDGVERYRELHTEEIDRSVSRVAGMDGVREWVKERIRAMKGSFVVEGRDMGSIVFPDAPHKFYLDAPVEIRAARRLSERDVGLAELTRQLAERDERDARQLAPAPDALRIDTGVLDVDGVANVIVRRIQENGQP